MALAAPLFFLFVCIKCYFVILYTIMQNNKKGERIMFDFLHRRKKINLKVTELTIILVLAGLCCSAISIVDESKLSWIPGNLGHYIIELSKRVY